jgi:hypothetical protein
MQPKQEKIREFLIHDANSVRIIIDAGNFDASLHHCLNCIAYCQSNRLLILLERVETEIPFWNGKRHVKKWTSIATVPDYA